MLSLNIKYWVRQALCDATDEDALEMRENYWALKRAIKKYRDTLPSSNKKWTTEQQLLMATFNKVLHEEHIKNWTGVFDKDGYKIHTPEFHPVT